MKTTRKGIASNTRECFSASIGCRIVGVLFGALPANDASLSEGTKTLVFDDGTGLTILCNGSFWLESEDTIKRAIAKKRRELEEAQNELRGVLKMAGK